MLSIANLLPGLTKSDSNTLEAEAEKRVGPRHGPAKFGYITAGQARRRHERSRAAEKRKGNRRYRKAWMINQRSVAALRGQLITVAAIKGHDGKYLVGQSGALMKNAHEALEATYGSVDAAVEHYTSILTERKA